ncbi:MAG: TonB-dependent receptor [Novosphingobium sp.]
MRMCLTLPLLLAASPALAEAPPIVVAGRALDAVPQTGTNSLVFTSQQLHASPSGRIEDVLAGVAGLQQFRRADSRSSNPTAQGLTSRGLGGNASGRTLVLLDGVPMGDPFFGSVPLSALAPERLASLRMSRGSVSGAFGAGGVAGTIELTSAGPSDVGLLNASVLADSRGESELSATLAPRLGQGFAVISGRWDRGQGFWTTPLAQRVPASVRARYESWSTALRGVAPLTHDIELQARALLYEDHRTLRFAGADNSARGQDASLRLVGRGAWAFDALIYVQARDFSNGVISSATFNKTLDQYSTPATGLGGKLELRPPVGGGHVLRLGSDWRGGSGVTREVAYNASTGAVTARRQAGGHQSDLGLFAEDDWTLGALALTAGARADSWSQTAGFFRETNAAGGLTTDSAFPARAGWSATFRGGAAFKPGGGLTLRAAGYSGLRLPTLNELYRPFTVFPVTTRANAALANEQLRGFEAGIDWQPGPGVTLALTAFDNRVNGAIANVTIGPNLRERRNVDAVHARGLELEAHGRRGQVSFDSSLSWTQAKVEASGASAALNGLRPAQVPELSANATLGWHPRPGWDLALTLRHTGAQYEDDLQVDVLPAATTLSAFCQVPLAKHFALVLRGENLTDAQVVTRNQAGSIDFGAPRTVWAGVTVAIR